MAVKKKPTPKSQEQLSQEAVGRNSLSQTKNRANQKSVKNDPSKVYDISLEDIDSSIFYYFNNVIKPSVTLNGAKIPVPVVYANPEQWVAVQKNGYHKDRNGKTQNPFIVIKRESVEKNRLVGNKIDANNPHNYGIFKKSYTRKNAYSSFSILNNRVPTESYYGVIMPDYVNIVYNCSIFTDYMKHMDQIIEAINFASDSYWGDPERFKFMSMIDNYSVVTDYTKGEDRTVKSTFNIRLKGYIIPDSYNSGRLGAVKFFNKSSIKITTETDGKLG